MWLYFSAEADWLDRDGTAIATKSLKDPEYPSVTKMLELLEQDAPVTIASMLAPLKAGAWGPMNSYVHTGILPMHEMLGSAPPTVAEKNLLNVNGLSTMAAMLIAVVSGDSERTGSVRAMQFEFRDCLPPLLPHAGSNTRPT